MSMLERAVADLADALETLETKITSKLANQQDSHDARPAIERHLRTAGDRTDYASNELSKAIDELKSLIGDNAAEAKDDGRG